MKSKYYTYFISLGLSIVISLSASPLYAIGGNDADPGNQISEDSQDCQADLLSAAAAYIEGRVNAITGCVNAYLDCEGAANATTAEACRAALLEVGVGACAQGVLDSGIETMANTAVVVANNSPAALDQSLITFVNSINADCYTAMNTELGTGGTGLGFAGDVSTINLMTDLLNRIPGGMGCRANTAVRESTPLIDTIADHLKSFDNKCIAVSDGETLYQNCAADADCGATSGKCGKIAFAFKNAGSSGFPDCPAACQAGRFLPAGGFSCVPCAPGRFSETENANTCTPCPAGRFTQFTNSSQCTECPRGFVQPSQEATGCIPCDPGTFQDESGKTACKQCAAGTASSTAAAECTACPAGSFSDAGANSCTACAPGSYATNTGSPNCSACPIGTFSEVSGRSSCTDCPVGTFAASEGSSSCSACAAGTFSSTTKSAGCQSCPAGKFSPAGSAECISCAAGTFSAGSGSVSCTPCPAGTFSEAGAAACTPCPAGSFSEKAGASACTQAPSGSFVASAGQSSLSQCSAGTFSESPGKVECSPCAAGTFSPVDGASACVKCPKNMIAKKAGAKICRACKKGKSNGARTKCIADS
ncbi:MAG: hypothetical protein J5J00_00185 [Deltaproteobacteria bacterium]|nr:hypothetical protein [Deltaproteobacteria bacterium]